MEVDLLYKRGDLRAVVAAHKFDVLTYVHAVSVVTYFMSMLNYFIRMLT